MLTVMLCEVVQVSSCVGLSDGTEKRSFGLNSFTTWICNE